MIFWPVIVIIGLVLLGFLYENNRRARHWMRQHDIEWKKRETSERNYHELLMWSIAALHSLRLGGIKPPRLPSHLRENLDERGYVVTPDEPSN